MLGLSKTAPTIYVRGGRVVEESSDGVHVLPAVDAESPQFPVGSDSVVSCAICGGVPFDDVIAMMRAGDDVFLCKTDRRDASNWLEGHPARQEQR